MGMEFSEIQQLWTPEPGWLNTASYGLPPRPAWEALQEALTEWRHGRVSAPQWEPAVDRAREAFARLVGVPAADVAIGSTTSGLLAPVAAALPDGAHVVAPDIEFTSTLFPWLVHEGRGITVTTVPPEQLANAIDTRTTAVAFSLVQSATGEIAAYQEIVAAARAHGALVIVDATQAAGWLPFDASVADVVVASGYKWLMAPRGVAYCYLAPSLRERLRPLAANWFAGADRRNSYYGPPLRLAPDARAYDLSPAWFCYVAAAPALELVNQIGVERIRAHNVGLANKFLAGLGHPPGDSAIVAVDVPGDTHQVAARLEAAGIRAAVRAGRVRVSFHLYSTDEDVDRVVAALMELQG